MPVIRQEDAPLEQGAGEGIYAELGPYSARLLSDAGGLAHRCLSGNPASRLTLLAQALARARG